MPRRGFQGKAYVKIPVNEIVREYMHITDIGLEELAEMAVEKIKQNTSRFGTRSGVPASKKLRTHIRASIGRYGGDGIYIAGAMSPHAHLLEDGHLLVKGGKLGEGGTVIGFVNGYHFVYDAEQEILDEAQSVVANAIGNHTVIVRS